MRALIVVAASFVAACGDRTGLGLEPDAYDWDAGLGSVESDGSMGGSSPSDDASAGDGVDARARDARADGPATRDASVRDAAGRDASTKSCASSCNGCCLGETCIPLASESASACGSGGAACVVCASTDTCVKGGCARKQPNCGPSNCTGCCLDADTCGTGDSAAACGFGGHACQSCDAEPSKKLVCALVATGGGTCTPMCSPNNCLGCCSGTTCLTGESHGACGTEGVVCTACAPDEICDTRNWSYGGTCGKP